MSIVELRQHVRGHLTLDKWDIFWNLGSITLETINWDTVIPQEDSICPPHHATPHYMWASRLQPECSYAPLSSGI